MHFPKSGGIALRKAFLNAFGAQRVLLDYAEDPADPATATRQKRSVPSWRLFDRFRNVRAVHGHFPIQKYDALRDSVRTVMLRNPVENLISIYYFWIHLAENTDHRGHELFHRFRDERPSLLEFARIPTFTHLMSRTYFGGYRMENFDIIGDFAQRERYCSAISRTMNVQIDTSIQANRLPASNAREQTQQNERVTRALRSILSDDMNFYERWTDRLAP